MVFLEQGNELTMAAQVGNNNDPNFQQQARDHLRLDSQMREALQQEAFQFYYQPILDLKTRQIREFEALIRWQQEGQW